MTKTFRPAVAALVFLAASVAAGASAYSTDSVATLRTVICPRLLGEVELAFGIWGGPGTSLRREFFAAVGSRGAQQPGGYAMFGSVTPSRAQTDAACAPVTTSASASQAGLSKPFTYRRAGANAYFKAPNGERLIGELLHRGSLTTLHLREPNGITFECPTSGRVLVRVRRAVGGTELRVSQGKAVLGVASLRANGASSFRVSARCRQD